MDGVQGGGEGCEGGGEGRGVGGGGGGGGLEEGGVQVVEGVLDSFCEGRGLVEGSWGGMGRGERGGGRGGVPWMICWSGFMGAMVARRVVGLVVWMSGGDKEVSIVVLRFG